MKFRVYTDGACSKNPGPGGYSFIILPKDEDGIPISVSGGLKETTNNCMELTAIVRALKHVIKLTEHYTISMIPEAIIYSDSAYCLNAINEKWLYSWQKNDWKTSKGKEIKNRELWEDMYYILDKYPSSFKFKKVKAHNGDKYNELADKLAKKAINRILEM